jgi:uncharacterized protein
MIKGESALTSEIVPFRAGLFSEEGGDVRLIGNRCSVCGQIYFPSRSLCFDCLSEDLAPVGFGRSGALYSYTVSHMASVHFRAPYYCGWIDVEEGIRVFAPVAIEKGRQLAIGMRMKLIVQELWREGEKSVTGYVYKPL